MLHKGKNESINFQPSEGQREPLCSNFGSYRCPSLGSQTYIFTNETIDSLSQLGNVYKRIRQRLISEGIINKYEKLK